MFSNKYEAIAQLPFQSPEAEMMSFIRFPLGENTNVPAFQLDAKELAYCIDFKINPGGRLQSRPAFQQYTTLAMAAAFYDAAEAYIDGTLVTLLTAGTKVYYLNEDLEPVEIGTTAGPARLIPYNNTCLVLDGSYLKYVKSLTEIAIAYDDGDDASAQVNNVHGEQDSSVNYTSVDRVATKFTAAASGVGYSIPVTRMAAIVEESGTADITFRVRKVSDDSIVAEKAYTGVVPASAGEIIVYFTAADITEELQGGTEYYASVEGTGFIIWYSDVVSGGTAYTYVPSVWTAVTTKIPCISLWPGLPPKASFGVIFNGSPFIVDPDEPGRRKFGNNTHLDWSTTGEAGYIGFGDAGKNSFPIGAMINLYGELITLGKKEWPHADRLTGTSPANYAVQSLFQKVWSTQDLVQNTSNELWLSSETGTFTFSGVDEFGDLRTHPVSEAITNAFESWSDDVISGYFPDDGQYWLFFPDAPTYIYVCHVKQPIKDADGKVRYPWVRYTNPLGMVKPTGFKYLSDKLLIGGDDGFVYRINKNLIRDLNTAYIRPKFKTAYMEVILKHADIEQIQTVIACRTGYTFTFNVYVNGQRRIVYTAFARSGAMADDVTIDEVSDILISDVMSIPIEAASNPAFFDVNINCFSVQFECTDFKVIGFPIFVDGFITKVRKLEE
jgi:hypothetical protein